MKHKIKMDGAFVLKKELTSLTFFVWNKVAENGDMQFEGDIRETANYLEDKTEENLRVSALDQVYKHYLNPVSARKWIDWYFVTALPVLEENDFDEDDLVPYPSNSLDSWSEEKE